METIKYTIYKLIDPNDNQKKMSESATVRKKRKLSDDLKNILREKAKERFSNPIERDKLRVSNKKFEDSKTPEQKLRDILVQHSKKVFQYDKYMKLIKIFPSIKNAEKVTGISSSNISKCCNHKVVIVGGYVWRFEGDLTYPVYKNRKSKL